MYTKSKFGILESAPSKKVNLRYSLIKILDGDVMLHAVTILKEP